MNNKAFIISGATSSGKSSLATQISNHKDIAIINADSLQIYKDLPILSSQPSKGEFADIQHYLYSYLDFNESSTVVDWLQKLKLAIEDSFAKNLTTIIVGGTGMYISTLLKGINKIPKISEGVRRQAVEIYDQEGKDGLIEAMLKLGMDKSDINLVDKQRLIRSYEVFAQTKKPMSYWYQVPKEYIIDPEIFTHINLQVDRADLYKKCDDRFVEMINIGAIEEVESLLKKVSDENFQITKTLGYDEIKNYLKGDLSKEEMINLACQKTRNYAKRQITWFKNQFSEEKIVFGDKSEALKFLMKNV